MLGERRRRIIVRQRCQVLWCPPKPRTGGPSHQHLCNGSKSDSGVEIAAINTESRQVCRAIHQQQKEDHSNPLRGKFYFFHSLPNS